MNINFTGFHKILKKHDKRLPNPCKAFYITRLHQQSWVRGDYSDVLVTLSRIYSAIRGDHVAEANLDEKQDFIRSTTKYWVHTEHISRVKYIILQHLPVFLQDSMPGDTDAQLVNSVYLDNRSLELYRGRLDKTPGAIALRLRWYGTSIPKTVFVERKTHRESWMGEISVKERFIIPETEVFNVLRDKYDKEPELKKMRDRGTNPEIVEEWETLVDEVLQAINSKQLEPTMRSQYMRTAFQIPFDATVRVSLDTNLCMINERTENVVSGERWYRDPAVEIPRGEITRFPHAVLEVKLQLENEGDQPDWLTELINSGMLLEVHKFSKFIHGCATLMTDEVQAVPYWIDDATLSESIRASGAGNLLDEFIEDQKEGKDRLGLLQDVNRRSHLNPHDDTGKVITRKKPALPERRADDTSRAPLNEETEDRVVTEGGNFFKNFLPEFCWDCFNWAEADPLKFKSQMIEPKLFFANERTFMKWLEMGVILSSASTAILAFSASDSTASYYAMGLLPICLLIVGYALTTYLWRATKIASRDATRWDDPSGPIVLTSLLIIALTLEFVQKIYQIYSQRNTQFTPST